MNSKKRKSNKAWRLRHPDRVKALKKAWEFKNPEKLFGYYLKKQYGIGIEVWKEFHKKQNGKCAICSVEGKRLDLDHDHKNGKMRGLLCTPCNVHLGFFEKTFLDNRHWVTMAEEYLNRTSRE